MLLYKGLKVKIKEPAILTGTLKADYERAGYVMINEIRDEQTVFVSMGGACNSISVAQLIPIPDTDILSVLEKKEKELKALEREIRDIKNFINKTCVDA